MAEQTIHLICHPVWMRDELATNKTHKVDHSLGLDVPSFGKKDSWWLPQAQAVQLLRAVEHHKLPSPAFTAPQAGLVTLLGERYTQRNTGLLTAEDVASVLVDWPEQFWKMSTAKSDNFEAKVRTHEELMEAIEKSSLPPHSLLEYSEVLTGTKRIMKEARFFVRRMKTGDLTISAYSVYLDSTDPEHITTVYDGAAMSDSEEEGLCDFVDSFLADDSNPELPPSFVVDAALLADGSHAIIEFNPSWCSAWYAADIDGVVATIDRGFQVTASEKKKWLYKPDSLLKQNYANPQRRIWGLA